MSLRKRADATTVQLPPKPQVLSPSGTFEGNDGKWSTFVINIAGDGEGKGQNFKVLISTSSPIALVPAQSEWCNETCSGLRGIMTSTNGQQPLGLGQDTSLWNKAGTYDLPKTYYTNSSLGGVWGLTTIGLGPASPQSITFPEQYVAAYTAEDYFLGSLGLSVGTISPTGAGKPTFLSSFAAHTDLMASSSYGYTAGASYRNSNRGVPGNMVFGGYDKSRFTQQGKSIGMPNKQNTTLIVGVLSIMYEPKQDVEANTFSFTTSPFSAIIDSTLPYLVLPDAICDQFAEKFNLGYDRTEGLYTVNDTAHERNIQQNATVSFKIGSGPQDSASFTTIILPYAAFDLQASFPIYQNPTNYFPLKKSGNSLYVLGRTFLQEAYIVVDYERANFTVAPAYFADPMPKEDLVSIWNTSYVLPTPPSNNASGGGLSVGAIAGIVIGIVGAFLLLGVAAFVYWKKRRNAKAKALQEGEIPSKIDTMAAGGEVKHRRVSELNGSDAPYSPGSKPTGTYYSGDHKHIGPISEMSPDSTPAELYSPQPQEGEETGYFAPGAKPRRRGATRGSSGQNTPDTPVAELHGDDVRYPITGQHPPQRPKPHSRGPSDNSLSTNIAEVLAPPAEKDKDTPQVQRKHSSKFVEHTGDSPGLSRAEQVINPLEEDQPRPNIAEQQASVERRPSGHARGLSDTTVNSESTAVSQPTPDELERWARSVDDDGPRRTLSQ